MISTFHGVGAYRGQRNPVALSRALSVALSGVEICAADRPIGAFGCLVLGETRAIFASDCWSEVVDGERVATGWHSEPDVVGDVDQCHYESLCQKWLGERQGYSEAWVSVIALRAIWVKEWAPEKTKQAARIIARNRGVPLLTVTGATRIWDVLDSNNLPFKWAA